MAAGRCARGIARRCARQEGGFTIIEVLAAVVVLAIGIGAVFQLLIAATHATATNRIRQAETSLARELTEDTRSLSYPQLTPSGIASALQATVPNSQVSGSSLIVQRPVGSTSSGASPNYSFTATFTACSLDDPADGYGSHSAPPISGGSWCGDVAASGTQDSNPDDYKRVSVTVAPTSGRTTPAVQQTILVYAKATHGPAVSCLSVDGTCPGANWSVTTSLSSLGFNATTTVPAASMEWLVNGSLPTSAQIGSPGVDPYTPPGSTSQFTWNFPTTVWNGTAYTVDGTYTVAALGFDANGNQGTRSSLQVTVNEHMAIPPSTVTAGWNQQIHGVDLQWTPSVDHDVQYYEVYNQSGQVAGCTQVTGLTCTDLSAPSPGTEPATCTGSPNNYQSFTTANTYWIIGVDKDPSGVARPSTFQSAHIDANLCDHPPSTPTGLTSSGGNGTVTLNWSLPSSPMDPDPGDAIMQWRIYRWPVGQNPSFPGSRLDLIGEKDSSGNDVTSYTDRSADPGGVAQDYCVTAVDSELNESGCSTIVPG